MIEQGTPEWHALRCGKVTASRVADVIRKTKSGVSASRARYMGELIAERLTGVQAEGFKTAEMQRGNDVETEAIDAYCFYSNLEIEAVAFVDHPRIAMSGASPDRLVDRDGLIEIKCPATHTHIATLLSDKIEADYLTQMHWQMACTGRLWCDFVSFDPRLPPEMQLYVKRVRRDDALIADLEAEVTEFLAEIDETIAKLQAKYGQKEAAE